MTPEQKIHVRDMAYKMRRHAESIATKMKELEETSLSDIPGIPDSETMEAIDGVFKDILHYCEAIRKVYDEMSPTLSKEITNNG